MSGKATQGQGPTITVGSFDGVHLGHQAILNQVRLAAAEQGGRSIVITFDPHPRKLLKPQEPIGLLTPLTEKIRLLKALGIDEVWVEQFTPDFAAQPAEEYVANFLVKQFHPAVIVLGHDHHFGKNRSGNIQTLSHMAEALGYELLELPAQLVQDAAVSSTRIRRSLQEGGVATARELLGRPYRVAGMVVHGRQLGRSIGFPTANLQAEDEDQLLPANGVYAAWVWHGGARHKAMINIGVRPTVSEVATLSVEAHLLDFSKDLYGARLEVDFIARLRNEQRFESLDGLKAQLQRDRSDTQTLLQNS